MTLQELYTAVHQLNRADKLRIMRFIADDLLKDDVTNMLEPGRAYEIWSPEDTGNVAQQLTQRLAADPHLHP